MKICDECETVAHCTKHGCIPKVSAKDSAMRLALEALKELVAQTEIGLFAVRHDHVAMQNARQTITALREALAEQPAPVQEPVIGETNVELGFYSNDARNEQLRELAGKVAMGQLVGNRPHESASNPDAKREIAVIAGVDEYGPMLNWYTHWVNFPVGTKLYTFPQPAQQKPIYQYQMANGSWIDQTKESHDYNVRHGQATVRVVYTSPPQRKPLTRDQVKKLITATVYDTTSPQERADFINGIRHAEAAHGIKENT